MTCDFFLCPIRGENRCRHYMIDMQSNGKYVILGEDRAHSSLPDLVEYHNHTGIKPLMELLTSPCGQVGSILLYYSIHTVMVCAVCLYSLFFFVPFSKSFLEDGGIKNKNSVFQFPLSLLPCSLLKPMGNINNFLGLFAPNHDE